MIYPGDDHRKKLKIMHRQGCGSGLRLTGSGSDSQGKKTGSESTYEDITKVRKIVSCGSGFRLPGSGSDSQVEKTGSKSDLRGKNYPDPDHTRCLRPMLVADPD